jgi:hypothetical protein
LCAARTASSYRWSNGSILMPSGGGGTSGSVAPIGRRSIV